jgi:hypothetical protein
MWLVILTLLSPLVEGYANGRHFDRTGGHAIAVGPDVAGTTKSIVTALQELIAADL